MSNINNPKSVPVARIMRRAAFIRGHAEALKGRPFDCPYSRTNEQWSYERGRLFGLVYPHAIKVGSKVLLQAQMAFGRALSDGTII